MKDLYTMEIGAWSRPCGGNQDNESDESCIETAPLAGGGVAVRDSKRPDLEPLRFTRDEVDAFVVAQADTL